MLNKKRAPLAADEVTMMRDVCKLAARTLEYVGSHVRAGISTEELDQIAHDYTLSLGCQPACLGYRGYPKTICTSVNDIICHGLPDGTTLKSGDIINVDVTNVKNGFFGDCSATFTVGNVSDSIRKLVDTAREARDRGIQAIRPNGTTGDIGFETEKFVTRKGYTTVKDIGGHGIGRKFHEDPFVPSFGKKGKGEILVPWTCITVEPMVNEGIDEIIEFPIDGSQVAYYRTADGKWSAQFEHTVLITDTSYEILTLPTN